MMNTTAPLQFAVHTERREGLVRDLPEGHEDQRWVANAATLIWGERDAVLVDTFATIEQNDRLVEWVRSHDRNLSAVYITHGHGDHAFGIGQLRAAFPGVRVFATRGTIAQLEGQASPRQRDGFWGRLFPGQIPRVELPEPLTTGAFELEGHEVRVIETGFTDSMHTTVAWVPDLGLLAAGDVVYNDTYPYLSESTAASRAHWTAVLHGLKLLDPRVVVSGHKKPERADLPSDIDATIRYLQDVAETEATTSDAIEFTEQMLAKQPGRANIGSLWGAAVAIKGAPAAPIASRAG